ncbi:FACT complex subunit spt16 [Kappamyces sp. JEL0680]|nr:FACT complex subunit spt16 [Kappamyces sp. JEL0680]
MSVQLDAAVFRQRAQKMFDYFNTNAPELSDCSSLLFIVGASDGELSYQKSISLQNWWIGYEFPETITLVLKNQIVFFTSQKKGTWLALIAAAILETLRNAEQVDFEVLVRTKDEAANSAMYAKLIDKIPRGKVGTITKEAPTGKVVSEWQDALKAAGTTLDTVDVSVALAVVMAEKDEDEMVATHLASKLTSLTMKNYFVDYVTGLVENGKKVTHEKLTEVLEALLIDERKRERIKAPKEVNWKLVEWCYPPIIQSGGKYDLKPSAQSNESNLHGGTVVCSFGVRYKSYCSNIARTILINPEQGKEDNYNFLLELQRYVLSILKPNVPCSTIYNMATEFIQSKRPDLKDHFVKNCGFGTGIEFRESSFVLGPKNPRELVKGMVINLTLGFQNLDNQSSDSRNRVYALLLGDTVQITDAGAVLLTDYDKALDSITYTFGEDEDDETKVVEQTLPKRGAILDSQLRNSDSRAELENKRRLHQQELFDKRQADGLSRWSGGKDESAQHNTVVFKKFESYRKDVPLPRNVGSLKVPDLRTNRQIVVDRRAESVILPIYGQAVPFHLSTLKNVSKSDEGEYTMLRFNFITPGQATGKKEVHAFEDERATFIRSLSFRSNEIHRLSEIAKEITDMKKDIQKRETERKEKAGLVDQADLIEVKGRRPIRLPDVFVRPGLEGKRFAGDLEIHINGLRYQSSLKSDQKVDVLFSNIKHLFFQPCDGELIVLLHIHLHDPIMIGKKKTKDIQFYRDVSDASFDETGNRRRRTNYGDEDELAQEQEERRHRQQLNKEFAQFSERISETSKKMVEVDVPARDLGFDGVPHRQLVKLQPTTDCLVHLSDLPFLVITLSDVEVAHLERVQDYTRPVVHINTIPVKELENVKEWLE